MTNPNENTDPIETAIQGGGEREVPPEIMNRGRRHLAALREKMEANPRPARVSLAEMLAIHWRGALACATPLAVLLLAAVLFWGGNQKGGGAAYAAVARQIRQAQTMNYTQIVSMSAMRKTFPSMPDMKWEVSYKEPGVMRMDASQGTIVIQDFTQKKLLILNTAARTAIVQDLTNASPDQVQQQSALIEHLRSLPERASADLGTKYLGQRIVQGFRVNENGAIMDVWIDARSRELVQIDTRMANDTEMQGTMTNFRFNVPLDPALFSMEIPAGYTQQSMKVDAGAPVEQDLVAFLKFWTENYHSDKFPSALNSQMLVQDAREQSQSAFKKGMELAKKAKQGQLPKPDKPMKDTDLYAGTLIITKGLMFVMQMKPENDFHYAGADVKPGEAGKPIAWWKPAGAQNYRVIYGDLTLKDAAAAELPKAGGQK